MTAKELIHALEMFTGDEYDSAPVLVQTRNGDLVAIRNVADDRDNEGLFVVLTLKKA